ncbi:MAG: BadF/BadG/BcrA/BcrD ATPase family protein [Sulfolobales archaeon]|nr:hypothetical protein [Sulfolobales archaeon]MDW8082768.1 BadF/BadG/BcrA/BcrD ATPase family protein [Sulfolobales archaeon]
MSRSVLVGVDAGGTKTEAVGVDLANQKCFFTSGGPSNPAVVGVDRASDVIADSIRKVLKGINREGTSPHIAAVSTAGIVSKHYADALSRKIAELLGYPADRVIVFEDTLAAHASVFLLDDGAVGILGTGSNVCAVYGDRVIRVGGWGHLLGDEGSGYRIGLRGLREVLECFDSLKRCSDLAEHIARSVGFKSTSDVLSYIYYSSNSKTAVSSIATLVMAAYRSGSEAAVKIVESEVEEFVKYITSVYRRVGTAKFKIGFVGSLYNENRDILRNLLREKLSKLLGIDVEILEQRIRTSCGAIIAGLKLVGDRTTLSAVLEAVEMCCLYK